MAEASDMIRVKLEDPTRCDAHMTGGGYCYFKEAVPGTRKCRIHGGGHLLRVEERKKVRMLQLTQWKEKLDGFAEHENVKTLREEIGVARIVLETLMNRCRDATDLVVNATRILEVLRHVQSLVVACDKLEQKSGILIDKQAALTLGQQIVTIISDEIGDEEILSRISDKIALAIIGINSPLAVKGDLLGKS